jgi:hypothetical protein
MYAPILQDNNNVRCEEDMTRVAIVDPADGDVIAREVQPAGPGGEFFLRDDGEVYYRHPYDDNIWYVNSTAAAFREVLHLLDDYRAEIEKCRDEESEMRAAQWFADQLRQLADYREDAFWASIAEQAELGQF